MTQLDMLTQLNAYINKQAPFAPSNVGQLQEGESVAVIALPQGIEITYFNGMQDKQQHIQIKAKSKQQENSMGFLNELLLKLEGLENLPSANDSYQFQQIKSIGMPSLVTVCENGYFIYQAFINMTITIGKGVV